MPENIQDEGIWLETAFTAPYKKLEGTEVADTAMMVERHRTSDRLRLPPPNEEYPTDPSRYEEFSEMPSMVQKMWLSIDRKLDVLVRHLGETGMKLEGEKESLVVMLGRNYLTMIVPEDIKMGESLLLRITPPTYPPFVIDLLGEVVAVGDAENGEDNRKKLNIQLKTLNPDDKELLISYLFKRQREILRRGSDI